MGGIIHTYMRDDWTNYKRSHFIHVNIGYKFVRLPQDSGLAKKKKKDNQSAKSVQNRNQMTLFFGGRNLDLVVTKTD